MGMSLAQLIQILSASIAPVIVISGVGLLLLSMTNRYSKVLDRARDLGRELETAAEAARRRLLVEEVKIIYRRARLLRIAIMMGVGSILLVAFTVLSLFAEHVFGARVDYFSVPCFSLSLVALLGALSLFIKDVSLSLAALELELGPHVGKP